LGQLCEDCNATFASMEDCPASDRASLLDYAHPRCACETCTASEHSPGLVQGPESLFRIVVAPQHVRKGRPRAAALADAERGGLSVFRAAHIRDDGMLKKVAEELVRRARERQGDKAGVVGVFEFTCLTLRHFRRVGEAMGCYCVYDTALRDDPSHAEAFQQVEGVDDAIKDDRRKQLFEAVQETFIPVAQFRGGLLSYLAPVSA